MFVFVYTLLPLDSPFAGLCCGAVRDSLVSDRLSLLLALPYACVLSAVSSGCFAEWARGLVPATTRA